MEGTPRLAARRPGKLPELGVRSHPRSAGVPVASAKGRPRRSPSPLLPMNLKLKGEPENTFSFQTYLDNSHHPRPHRCAPAPAHTSPPLDSRTQRSGCAAELRGPSDLALAKRSSVCVPASKGLRSAAHPMVPTSPATPVTERPHSLGSLDRFLRTHEWGGGEDRWSLGAGSAWRLQRGGARVNRRGSSFRP